MDIINELNYLLPVSPVISAIAAGISSFCAAISLGLVYASFKENKKLHEVDDTPDVIFCSTVFDFELDENAISESMHNSINDFYIMNIGTSVAKKVKVTFTFNINEIIKNMDGYVTYDNKLITIDYNNYYIKYNTASMRDSYDAIFVGPNEKQKVSIPMAYCVLYTIFSKICSSEKYDKFPHLLAHVIYQNKSGKKISKDIDICFELVSIKLGEKTIVSGKLSFDMP